MGGSTPPPPPPPPLPLPALLTHVPPPIHIRWQACWRRPRSQRLAVHAASQDAWQQQQQQEQAPASLPLPGGAVGRFLAAFNSSPRSVEGMLSCLAPDVAYHNLALAPEPFRGQQASGRAACAGREGCRQT